MKIEIKEEQLQAFLQTAYIGKYVVNDVRSINDEQKEFKDIFCSVYDLYVNYLTAEKNIKKDDAVRRTDRLLSVADKYLDFYVKSMLPSALAAKIAEKKYGTENSDEKLIAEEMYEDILENDKTADVDLVFQSKEPAPSNQSGSKIFFSANYDKLVKLFEKKRKSFDKFLIANDITKDDVIKSFECGEVRVSSKTMRKICVYLGMSYADIFSETAFGQDSEHFAAL